MVLKQMGCMLLSTLEDAQQIDEGKMMDEDVR